MNAQGVFDPQNPDAGTNLDSVAWSPDGSLLAMGSGIYEVKEGIEDYWVRVVNIATQQVIFSVPLFNPSRLMWNPSGDELYVGSIDGAIRRYDMATGVLLAALAERDIGVWYRMAGVSLSPDGSRIAAIFRRTRGSVEFTIYDTQALQPVVSTDLPFTLQDENTLTWVGYSPDGSLLATTGWDGVVRLWDANTLSQVAALSTSPGKRLYTGDWSADGRLAVGGLDHYITIWNVDTQQIINQIDVGGVGYALRWHPDGRQIATGGGAVWDSLSGQKVQGSAPHPSGLFWAIDWSPSGVLAVGQYVQGRLTLSPDGNPLGSLASVITVPPLPTPTPASGGGIEG
jgi:WD40 repeat protein